MTIFNTRIFEQIEQHADHTLSVETYHGDDGIANVAIECRDCELVVHDIEPEPANDVVPQGEPTGEDPDGTVDVASDTTELTEPHGPLSEGDTA